MKEGDYVFHPLTGDVGRILGTPGGTILDIDSAVEGGEIGAFASEWIPLSQAGDGAAAAYAAWYAANSWMWE